jgi:molybdopterin-containing oxidoreductase family membrane subunit
LIHEFLRLNYQGYNFLLIPVLLAVMAIKKLKAGGFVMLEAMNMLLAICGAIGLMLFVISIPAQIQDGGFALTNRLFGPYWLAFWFSIIGSYILPQLFWVSRYRKSLAYSILVLVGINNESVMRLMYSLHRDYIPSSWVMKQDLANPVIHSLIYAGLVGLTFTILKRLKSNKMHNPSY